MAKVTNALFSFRAAGSVAGLLNIQQPTGTQIARRKPNTRSDPTTTQAHYRAQYQLAADAWHAITDTERADWTAYAARRARPPFAAYCLEWMAQHSTPATPPWLPATDPA